MEASKKRQSAKGMILAPCPACRGTGKVPREAPLLANPKDPAIRAYRTKLTTCPRCQGRGRLGIE